MLHIVDLKPRSLGQYNLSRCFQCWRRKPQCCPDKAAEIDTTKNQLHQSLSGWQSTNIRHPSSWQLHKYILILTLTCFEWWLHFFSEASADMLLTCLLSAELYMGRNRPDRPNLTDLTEHLKSPGRNNKTPPRCHGPLQEVKTTGSQTSWQMWNQMKSSCHKLRCHFSWKPLSTSYLRFSSPRRSSAMCQSHFWGRM